MDKNFDFTTMDALLERLQQENNPQNAALVNDLIMLSKKAGDLGFSMKEIASLTTLGYFVSQEPELQSLLNFLLSKTKPDDIFN
tara:strand:- start:866 stop:1117 length:252 start_codon:yes stop_codon:yes gene_type:complete